MITEDRTRRKLPIGIQNFKDLRLNDYLYVDKTAYIYELVTSGKPYFLSRPRRFGKSLLISTLESYFRGERELFGGLAIERLETEWIKYPVLHLDLNAEKFDNAGSLEAFLNSALASWEDLYGQREVETTLSLRFKGVIRRACELTGQQVVVLVDEYDKPLLQAINNEPLLTEFKNTLKAFYAVLKSSDEFLKFVFLTGVTKFGQVSVFSDLNQLLDISMNARYAGLCGITGDELARDFALELKLLGETNGLNEEETREKMKRQYDGYRFHWSSEGVYNPFSVLNVFNTLEFENYWFKTGTPTFLVELLKRTDYDLRNVDGVELNVEAFADYRADATRPIPVIYQSGYLTIKSYDRELKLYTLGFPNDEVKYGFLGFVAPYYTEVAEEDNAFYIGKFVQELRRGDVEAFLHRMKAFFADFPYELNDRTERHYQVVFYLVFKLLGQFVDVEVKSARGRADAVVKTADRVYVFEFKLDGSAESALRQIEEKGYLIPYSADGKELVKIGVAFDAGKRNIGEYLVG